MTDHDNAEDEREAFWSAWIHLTIIVAFGLAVFSITAWTHPHGWFHTASLALLAIFTMQALKLAWEAVSFVRDRRRDAR